LPDVPPKGPQQDDPITSSSFSFPLMIAAVLLMVTVAWSMWDEMYGLRPWRLYQRRFASAYSSYLQKDVSQQRKLEADVYSSPDYKKLAEQADSLEKTAKPKDDEIAQQIGILDTQRAAIGDAFKDARGKIGHLVYELEITPASDKSGKASRLKELNEAKQGPWKVDWPLPDGQIEKDKKFTADELNDTFTNLMAQRAALVAERGENDGAAKAARILANQYLSDHLPGLNSTALEGLLNSARDWDETLIQINVNPSGASINNLGGAGLVDRCQSCHVGTDQKLVPSLLVLTKADLGMAKSNDAPFTSHPDPELLKIHTLEKFGCSPCHGGNGRAIDSVRRGHGRYEHWLWPLY